MPAGAGAQQGGSGCQLVAAVGGRRASSASRLRPILAEISSCCLDTSRRRWRTASVLRLLRPSGPRQPPRPLTARPPAPPPQIPARQQLWLSLLEWLLLAAAGVVVDLRLLGRVPRPGFYALHLLAGVVWPAIVVARAEAADRAKFEAQLLAAAAAGDTSVASGTTKSGPSSGSVSEQEQQQQPEQQGAAAEPHGYWEHGAAAAAGAAAGGRLAVVRPRRQGQAQQDADAAAPALAASSSREPCPAEEPSSVSLSDSQASGLLTHDSITSRQPPPTDAPASTAATPPRQAPAAGRAAPAPSISIASILERARRSAQQPGPARPGQQLPGQQAAAATSLYASQLRPLTVCVKVPLEFEDFAGACRQAVAAAERAVSRAAAAGGQLALVTHRVAVRGCIQVVLQVQLLGGEGQQGTEQAAADSSSASGAAGAQRGFSTRLGPLLDAELAALVQQGRAAPDQGLSGSGSSGSGSGSGSSRSAAAAPAPGGLRYSVLPTRQHHMAWGGLRGGASGSPWQAVPPAPSGARPDDVLLPSSPGLQHLLQLPAELAEPAGRPLLWPVAVPCPHEGGEAGGLPRLCLAPSALQTAAVLPTCSAGARPADLGFRSQSRA